MQRYFKDSEWKKDPNKVSALLKEDMEAIRGRAGVPVIIHVAWDDSGHAPNSYHYKGLACDFHFGTGIAVSRQLDAIIEQPGINGIGYYPYWRHPGWHVDRRDGHKLFWVLNSKGQYDYFRDLDAFKKAIGISATLDPQDIPEQELLARVLWGECRGGEEAAAIAWVVRNRVEADLHDDDNPDWWGEGYRGVLLKPYQFSCLNLGDPNRDKLLSVTERNGAFRECLRVASLVMSGEIPDPSGGATGYHANYVSPAWARGKTPTAKIGKHLFYKVS